MNKSLLLLALIAATAFASTSTVTVEEGVHVLTESNFNDFIKSQEFVLVEFYAPWCGHCKKLTPEYAKAASTLMSENSKAVLAKVDATLNKELATRFSVQGFPTMKFFTGSLENPVDYSGGRTEKDLVSWIRKKTSPSTELIHTSEQLRDFISKNQVAIIYYGESESDSNWSIFKAAAMAYDEFAFAHVFNPEIRRAESASDLSLVLYKQFDERRNNFSDSFTSASIKSFIEEYSVPLVMPFNDRAIQRVFQQGNPTIFLFSDDNEASRSAETVFTEAAKINKGKVIFSISKPNDGHGHYQRLADYVGVNTSLTPQIVLIKSSNEILKYKFTSTEITVDNITSFISQYLSGKLSVYIKSEEPPTTNDEPVKTIVGKTFDEIVRNSSQDILVEFYAPWCGHCKQLTPIYETVAKKLSHNKNIVIAKIDSTANEVSGISIKGFPTLKFFPSGKKSTPMDFEGERSEAGIMKFLKEKTTYPWVESKDEL